MTTFFAAHATRIGAKVRTAILSSVGAVLYSAGWITARTKRTVLVTALWCGSAVKLGWKDGSRGPNSI